MQTMERIYQHQLFDSPVEVTSNYHELKAFEVFSKLVTIQGKTFVTGLDKDHRTRGFVITSKDYYESVERLLIGRLSTNLCLPRKDQQLLLERPCDISNHTDVTASIISIRNNKSLFELEGEKYFDQDTLDWIQIGLYEMDNEMRDAITVRKLSGLDVIKVLGRWFHKASVCIDVDQNSVAQ